MPTKKKKDTDEIPSKSSVEKIEYVSALKTIWTHTKFAYANFFHWNFSKISIFLKTFFIAFLLNIPVLLSILGALIYIQSTLSEAEMTGLLSGGIETLLFFQNHIGITAFVAVLAIFGFTLALLALSYSWYLLAELSEKYAKGGSHRYFERGWWKWSQVSTSAKSEFVKFRRFCATFGWISLGISLPSLVSLFIFIILFAGVESGYINKGNDLSMQVVGVVSSISIFILIAGTLYLLLRYMYAPLLLLEKSEITKSGREIGRASWNLTRGKVLRVFLWLLPFVLVLGVLKLPLIFVEQEIKVHTIGEIMKKAQAEDPDTFENDHTFIQTRLLNLEALNESDLSSIIEIGNSYNPQITEINKSYLREMLPYIEKSGTLDGWDNLAVTLGFGLFAFLVFSSIESQFLYGSYTLLRKEEEVL